MALDDGKKMDIIPFLKRESELWEKGIECVNERRKAWSEFENKAKTNFNSIVTEAKTQKLFDNLYVQSVSDLTDSEKSP